MVRVLIRSGLFTVCGLIHSWDLQYIPIQQCCSVIWQFVSGPLKGQGHSVLWKPTSQFTTEEDRWYHVIYYYFERGIYLAPSVFWNSENRDHLMPNICFYKINFLWYSNYLKWNLHMQYVFRKIQIVDYRITSLVATPPLTKT